jgi:hypothetical protein
MKGLIIILFYFLGIVSTVLLGIYLFALVLFVFGHVEYPGEIAFLPKWIFLLIIFVFLKKTKIIQGAVDWFVERFEALSDNLDKKINQSFNNFFD